MPGGNSDFFYQYDALPFDSATDKNTDSVGYFGYKVLAVSYGGTLNLFGKKGALYGAQEPTHPQNSGDSWVRLAATTIGVKGGGTAATPITLSSAVDWQVGDHVVVTTTDYLANHSEEAVICGATSATSFTVTTDLTSTRLLARKNDRALLDPLRQTIHLDRQASRAPWDHQAGGGDKGCGGTFDAQHPNRFGRRRLRPAVPGGARAETSARCDW